MIEATKVGLRNVQFHPESWGRLGRQIALCLFVTLLCTKQEISLMKFLPLKKQIMLTCSESSASMACWRPV